MIWALSTFPLDDLLSRKQYSEAARVMLDYSENVEGAVLALVQGNEVSEALRIVCSLQLD